MGELNRRIAELLGWRVEEYFEAGDDDASYALIEPDGTKVHDGTWERPYTWSEADAWTLVPDFEHDLNAVEEVLSEDYSLEIWTTGDDKPAGMVRKGSQCFYGRGATTRKQAAALALERFLIWKASL